MRVTTRRLPRQAESTSASGSCVAAWFLTGPLAHWWSPRQASMHWSICRRTARTACSLHHALRQQVRVVRSHPYRGKVDRARAIVHLHPKQDIRHLRARRVWRGAELDVHAAQLGYAVLHCAPLWRLCLVRTGAGLSGGRLRSQRPACFDPAGSRCWPGCLSAVAWCACAKHAPPAPRSESPQICKSGRPLGSPVAPA